MTSSNSSPTWYEPGQWVRNPNRPDWGDGQIQSVIGFRVTVNFTHAGKVLINASVVTLELVRPNWGADDLRFDA